MSRRGFFMNRNSSDSDFESLSRTKGPLPQSSLHQTSKNSSDQYYRGNKLDLSSQQDFHIYMNII